MKNSIFIIAVATMVTLMSLPGQLFAQAPQKMSYQTVIRDADDALVQNSSVGIRISVLQGSANGTVVFVETHPSNTNANGLASLSIGTGTPVTRTMAGIDWSAGPYFIKTETDPTGGTNYSIDATSELTSVPYALYAMTTDNVDDADADPENELQNLSISGNDLSISNGNTVTLPSMTSSWILSGDDIYSNSGGNVGIGTSAPTHKLHVQGNIWLGVSFLGGGNFTPSSNVLYMHHQRKYIAANLLEGTLFDGTNNWVNLMTHPFSAGFMFGLSGPDDTDPHSTPTPLMVIRNNGKVGMGTFQPTALLDVHTGSEDEGSKIILGNQEISIIDRFLGNDFAAKIWGHWPGDGRLHFGVNSNGGAASVVPTMTIRNVDGNGTVGSVGIGTTAPQATLDVVGSTNTIPSFPSRYFNSTSNVLNPIVQSPPFSTNITIRASSGIMAGLFLANSDSRIKNVVGISNPKSDLELVNMLKVTNYTYIDQIENGNKVAKGFIAQEIAEIIPEAVSKSIKFIPSVYALANTIELAENGNARIILEKTHGLKTGDKVRLITAEKSQEVTVQSASELSFEVEVFENWSETVFVYGKEVDDFQAVDYDRIFTTGISAIQELSKLVIELQAENASLKDKQSSFEADYTSIKAELELIKKHLGIDFQVHK